MKDQERQQQERERPGSGFSRRSFLKGSGAAAAATALAAQTEMAAAAEANTAILAPGPQAITLNVNGKDHKLTVETRTTLLDALRYSLSLTGAKPVSIDGSSGASTVWLEGKTVSANTVFAVACVGKKVRTVESLGGAKPDAVATAFVHNDAMQCGFCTPGFVVAVRSFLDKNPKATEEEIRKGLSGNLCRCGTYYNVISAALEVVKGGK
jgi:xanthine dehydrogenase YagT iron-sulfur-binding subunit